MPKERKETVGLDCANCKNADNCYGQECYKERDKERRRRKFERYRESRGMELDYLDDD